MARINPQSEAGCNDTTLDVGNGIVGEQSRLQQPILPDECVTARETTLSDVGCDIDSMDVDNDIVGNMPEHPIVDMKGECVVAREKNH